MTQKPSVGRIVHYQSYGTPGGEYLPEPRAAIITEVASNTRIVKHNGDGTITEMRDLVGLCVLNPTGQFFNREVPYAETPTPGHWNWPPRTDEASLCDCEVAQSYTCARHCSELPRAEVPE